MPKAALFYILLEGGMKRKAADKVCGVLLESGDKNVNPDEVAGAIFRVFDRRTAHLRQGDFWQRTMEEGVVRNVQQIVDDDAAETAKEPPPVFGDTPDLF